MRERTWLVVMVCVLWVECGALASRSPPVGRTPASIRKTADGSSFVKPETSNMAMEHLAAATVELMVRHPSREVREDLVSLMREDAVWIDFWFQESDDVSDLVTVGYIRRHDSNILTLHVNAFLLFDVRVSDVAKQLVLFHSWVHIRQQRTGTYPKWLVADETPSPLSRRQMSDLFYSELEAVLGECGLAISLRHAQARKECVAYQQGGLSVLRELVAEGIAAKSPYNAQRALLFQIARENK